MAKQKQDPKVEWGFYSVVPRIVRTQYKQLSHTEKWLYTCLKDLCGDKGMCYRTLRVLAQETDLSIGNLSTGIRKLHEAGLIHAEKKRRSINPTAKEVWHISIVDIWLSNVEYCSKYEQSTGDNVQDLNNNVQNINNPPLERSENEQKRSNFDDRRITPKNNNIEERTIEEESIVVSAIAENDAPAPINFEERKRKTDPSLPVVSHSHNVDIGNDEEEDVSLIETQHRIKAIVARDNVHETRSAPDTVRHANHGTPHPSSISHGSDLPDRGMDARGMVDTSQEVAQQKPGAGTPVSLAADPPIGGQDGATSVQAQSSVAGTPAQRSGISAAGIPASTDAAQANHIPAVGKMVVPKRPRAKKPPVMPQFTLTAQEQAFWDLWCSVWFNAEIKPTITETAYTHIAKLAPYITAQEQLNSLIDYTRKDLADSIGMKRKMVQLGNMVHCYSGWKQAQQSVNTNGKPAQNNGVNHELNMRKLEERKARLAANG
jgi:DNA-binding transcriptional regulator GbsR (MarR family)